MRFVPLIVLIAMAALITPAAAQFSAQHPDGVAMPPVEEATKGRVGGPVLVPSQSLTVQSNAIPGGPVAIGQMQAEKDAATGKVTIVQAPAVAAAPVSGGVIQLSAFGWLEPYVDSAVQGLIVLFFGILGKSKYTQWLDQSSRDALETFVKNRAASLIADGAVKMQNKSVHVDNPLLYRAASQASIAIPDALKRFGITPDVVAAKIVDAIPQTAAGAAIIADAHKEDSAAPIPVETRPTSPWPDGPAPAPAPAFQAPPTAPVAAA
jgi:hypothetical protein